MANNYAICSVHSFNCLFQLTTDFTRCPFGWSCSSKRFLPIIAAGLIALYSFLAWEKDILFFNMIKKNSFLFLLSVAVERIIKIIITLGTFSVLLVSFTFVVLCITLFTSLWLCASRTHVSITLTFKPCQSARRYVV